MYNFEEISQPGVCNICGAETDVAILCSPFSAISHAYCHDCFWNGYESYGDLVSIACCGYTWPDGFTPDFVDCVRRNLTRLGKTEKEFAQDVEALDRDMTEYYRDTQRMRISDEDFPFG